MRCQTCEAVSHIYPVLAVIAILIVCASCTAGATVLAAQPPEPQVTHWMLTTADDWHAGTLDGLMVVTGERGDATLTLAHGRAAGRFTSAIHRAPFPLTAAALFWRSDTIDGSGMAVELRLSQDQATWSPWYPIYRPETQSDGYTYGENIIASEGAQYVQARMTLSALTPTHFPNLNDLTVVLIDTSNAPTPAQALAASTAIHPTAIDMPTIISRQAWGADPAYLDWDPEYASVQRIVLHHTVTAGGGNPVGEVQAIYYYHAVTRGWGDIGYNYLVGPYGNIYEGRYGGDDVIGAHTARWNTGALGVALLGCYHPDDCSPDQTPSDPALDAVADLVAWTASRRVIDPRQGDSFTNPYGDPPLTLSRFSGHRDYSQYIDGQWYNATSCPGDTLYDELSALRDEAWSHLPDDDVRFEGHDIPTLLQVDQALTVSLSIRNAGVATWTPGEVTLGYRWLEQNETLVSQTPEAGFLPTEIPFAASPPMTATLTAPSLPGTYILRWDLYRPGVGWFGELSSASQPLAMTVKVVESASQTQHLFLPLIMRGTEPANACSELLVNGGAESDQAWEFLGGWPGAYSSLHVRSGDRAIRLGVESSDDDGHLYSSVQQTVGLPAEAAQIALDFWYFPTSSNADDDRAYVALLDSSGELLDIIPFTTSDASTWQPVSLDLTDYRGETVTLRYTVLNRSSPGITAGWLDDMSLLACGP